MDSKQSGAEKKQLTALKSNKLFQAAFSKLVLDQRDLADSEKVFLLSCSILLFKHYDLDKRYLSYFKLGYYIILKYSILFDDYKPLYDVCLQIGFYPISDFLIRKNILELESLDEEMINKSINRKYLGSEDYIESLEQNACNKAILNSLENSIAYIAPTSYGKSSIIKDVIKNNTFGKIGIIVPTKSLLIQTYNDIKALRLDYKLILHDEMYADNSKFIGILTQERATRMILKFDVNFDILFIDEAHNLLERDSRSFILARLIQLNIKRNPTQKIIYLSPLIEHTNNIKLIRTDDKRFLTRKIRHDFKVSDLYLYDQFESYIYDKFTGEFYDLEKPTKFYDYILQNSKSKNFIYHNRPKLIEDLAIALSSILSDIELNAQLNNLINTLKEEVHDNFYMVPLIKKGIVYLHGKIPNIIKEYLEYKFKTIEKLRYIVANSVILEGINLPIDTLFITSTYGLNGKELTNLIGRVNRLNYVFKNEDLKSLISSIHFLNSDKYQGVNSDIKNKMKLLRNHSFDDRVENPLLVNYNIEKLKLDTERKKKREIENVKLIEATDLILSNDDLDPKKKLKKYLVENSIDEFYKDLDLAVNIIFDRITNFDFTTYQKIVDIVSRVFVIGNEGNIRDFEVERLKNDRAVNFYSNFFEVTQKQMLKDKINSTIRYFKIKADSDDPQLYIGRSYGEEIRYSDQYNNKEYVNPVYVNLKTGSYTKLVNWAIVKIKIEEDFVSFKLNKLIVFLYEFKIISEDYYFKHLYGTADLRLIEFVRFGLNVSIVKKLDNDNQLENLVFDVNGNLTSNNEFSEYIAKESELFQFEINKYLGTK